MVRDQFVGLATVDVTPPVGIARGGYSPPRPLERVLDPLSASVLLLEIGGRRAVVVSVDSVGLQVEFSRSLRQEIAEVAGTGLEAVYLACSHTHSGPSIDRAEFEVRAYEDDLRAKLIAAAKQAKSHPHSCRLSWGMTTAHVGINRRLPGPEGDVVMGDNISGPVDDRVLVLRVDDQRGAPLALLLTVAAHPNVLKGDNTAISADWPGTVRNTLTRALGCPVIVLTGAAGDVNPIWRGTEHDLSRVAHAITSPVLDLLGHLEQAGGVDLWAGSTTLDTDLVTFPDSAEAAKLAQDAAEAWEADTRSWLATIAEYRKAGVDHVTIPVEIALLRLGDWWVSGIPMEPFSQLAIDIAARTGNGLGVFCGYTNGYYGYLATAAQFALGGYEVRWMPVAYGPMTGLMMPPRPETAEIVTQAVIDLYRNSMR